MSSTSRKVKGKAKAAPKKAHKPRRPIVVKRKGSWGPAHAPSASHLAAAHEDAPAASQPPAAARMARALAAASSEMDDVQVKSGASGAKPPTAVPYALTPAAVTAPRPRAPPGPPTKGKTVIVDDGDAQDGTDGAHDKPGFLVMSGSKPKVEKSEDGLQVLSKGPAKFSMEDMEALRKAIVIKGSGLVVAGINLDELKYNEEGLVAVVAQDRLTGAVLMQAWANKEALQKSLTTNEMTYWSRQRNKLWTKGEESGHTQALVSLKVDCDKDSVLAIVDQTGPACHRDTGTCFVDDRAIPVAGFLGELDRLVASRAKEKPEGSYTTKLLEDPSLAAGKVVEEAKEVAMVLKGRPNPDTLQHEAADLLYHLLVALRGKGIGLREIVAELQARHGKPSPKDKEGKAKA